MPLKQPPDLYPQNRSTDMDDKLFANPTAIYRGAPFWSWNNKLRIEQLIRQIDQLGEMGFGGFIIHPRTGLETEYLGKEYMQAVVACTEHAAKRSMLSWLYDEDRWPSGFAGGLVTKDHQFRSKRLFWTSRPYHGTGTLLAQYEITLRNGFLARYRRLNNTPKPRAGAKRWSAFLETAPEESWYNNQTYVDTFARNAIQRFIEITHERYAAAVGNYFGSIIPAIFTDEPQFLKKTTFSVASEDHDLVLPFTTDFPETYKKTYRQDLLDHLPELFWNLPNNAPSAARYRYHDHTAERFAEAFGDTLGQWCQNHGIPLTGHMLGESKLFSQTRGVGEVMRGLRAFHIPGIDMLEDKMELTTAKQAQSIAHQFGRLGVMSELYGVTNWDFDFVGHKAQGDWQAALGVTLRVPHLAWVSMAGESKRDYPAAIGHQSPWFKEYPLIEDHFGRINTIMTRGKPLARVAVIHPLESYWLCFGPLEQNRPEMQAREEAFENLPAWLLFGLIDFDYISEALFPHQSPKTKGKRLVVGKMTYDAIVLPGLRTLRASTLARLESFAKNGGTVIFAGTVPTLVDAKPSQRPHRLAKRSIRAEMNQRGILDALAPFRTIDIQQQDGSPSDSILHHIRVDGKRLRIFLCNTDRRRPRNDSQIHLPGKWDAVFHDTHSGRSRPIYSTIKNNRTTIPWNFPAHGHLLLTLAPHRRAIPRPASQIPFVEIARLSDPVPVTLSEPNVLMLDQAAWRSNDGPWQPIEEILRLDNIVREQFNLPPRGGKIVQPWTDTAPAPIVATLQLKFKIQSEVHVDQSSLAIEISQSTQIHLDGQPVPSTPTGWWVDESIKTIPLPSFAPGLHELCLTIPFTRKTNVEWCYLLGDFGVKVSGRHAAITPPGRQLAFGDWTNQGLPFYGGNVTYHCTIDGTGNETLLAAPRFKSPLLSLNLDGKPAGKIAFAPFELPLGTITGRHSLDITAFGNRVNCFGAVHNTDEKLTWFGPPAWRQTGPNWSYEYQLRPTGILVAPIIKTAK